MINSEKKFDSIEYSVDLEYSTQKIYLFSGLIFKKDINWR